MSTFSLKFYGTRGSLPVCDPRFMEFGGDTTCISLHRKSKDLLTIFDAGTGLRKLGKDINTNFPDLDELMMIFSHFHWDHIQGFPFFCPAYNPNVLINMCAMGVNYKCTDLQDIFKMQQQALYFPVSLDKMGSVFNFLLHKSNQIEYQGTLINGIKQNHPGDSYGYRIEEEDKVIVICTDIEHGVDINEEIVQFAKNADLLIHDAQYTSEELKAHKGWGHSSYDQAIEVAERANVKQLIMTHHDPDHDDEFLKKIEKKCQYRFRNCALARQGMVIEI